MPDPGGQVVQLDARVGEDGAAPPADHASVLVLPLDPIGLEGAPRQDPGCGRSAAGKFRQAAGGLSRIVKRRFGREMAARTGPAGEVVARRPRRAAASPARLRAACALASSTCRPPTTTPRSTASSPADRRRGAGLSAPGNSPRTRRWSAQVERDLLWVPPGRSQASRPQRWRQAARGVGCGWSRKKRSISRDASGPCGSV